MPKKCFLVNNFCRGVRKPVALRAFRAGCAQENLTASGRARRRLRWFLFLLKSPRPGFASRRARPRIFGLWFPESCGPKILGRRGQFPKGRALLRRAPGGGLSIFQPAQNRGNASRGGSPRVE